MASFLKPSVASCEAYCLAGTGTSSHNIIGLLCLHVWPQPRGSRHPCRQRPDRAAGSHLSTHRLGDGPDLPLVGLGRAVSPSRQAPRSAMLWHLWVNRYRNARAGINGIRCQYPTGTPIDLRFDSRPLYLCPTPLSLLIKSSTRERMESYLSLTERAAVAITLLQGWIEKRRPVKVPRQGGNS